MNNFPFLDLLRGPAQGHRRPGVILKAFFLTSVVFVTVHSQTCPSGARQVTEFGPFTANTSDSATIARNQATITAALTEIGESGGGTICLPQGIYYIGPNPAVGTVAITIRHDNITLCGAGVGKTILRTNGTWNATTRRRGHGIRIVGTANRAQPRKNIVLRDFELDGQAGWTGNYCWTPLENCGENGWDISHKGIMPSIDDCVDSVTLENLHVHHYRGEILYCGGMGMGRLVVRNVRAGHTNGSCLNLYGADLLVENCTFDGPSRFWMELTARQNQGGHPVNRSIFRRNVFINAVGATAIVMCQGDFRTCEFVFDSNTIYGCPGVFGIYGGVAGPVRITGNTIDSCGTVLEFGQTSGWVNSGANANITMERNTVTRGGSLASFYATGENVTVRGNDFGGRSATDRGRSTAVFYGAANLRNCVVEGNTFRDCRTPEQTAIISGTRPLFRNNTYVNVERRHTHGLDWVNTASPKATPHCEEHQIMTDADNSVAILEHTLYPHGQLVRLFGGSTTRKVRFATGQSTYSVAVDRYLDGTSPLWFRYDSAQVKWIETSAPVTRTAPLVPIPPKRPVMRIGSGSGVIVEDAGTTAGIWDASGRRAGTRIRSGDGRIADRMFLSRGIRLAVVTTTTGESVRTIVSVP